MIIWGLTVVGNVILTFTLLWRGHSFRYRIVLSSAILSVLADIILWHAYAHDAADYALLRRIAHALFMGLNLGIIWEGWVWQNRAVRVPVELYLGIKLIAFLAEKAGFLWTAYYVKYGLRAANLAMIVWFIWVFRKEPIYERREA